MGGPRRNELTNGGKPDSESEEALVGHSFQQGAT